MFPGIPTLLWSPTSQFCYYKSAMRNEKFFPGINHFSQFLIPHLSFLIFEYNMQFIKLPSLPEDFPVPYTTQKPSIISTGLLKPLLTFHLRPIQQVVSLRSYTFQSRELILKRVSHLDAFSGYLFRTWLLSGAPGGTTDTPEVRPPRSSRTRGSPSQFSFAHSG